jgi:hypothetical protein
MPHEMKQEDSEKLIREILDTHINQVAGWFYHGQIAPYLPELIQFMLTELNKRGIKLVQK